MTTELTRDQIINLISPSSKNSEHHDLAFANRVIDAMRDLTQRPAAQTEREADVYGSTDIPWSFAVSRKLEPQEKRLMSMLVKAFGADHPSIDDMAQLILTRSAPKPPAPTSGNILTDAFNEVQALKQQATPTREAREAEQRARMQARLATSHEGKATADFDLPAPNDAPQQATPAQEPGVFREYFDAHRALIAAKGVSERASHAHIVGYRAPSHSTGSEPYAASVARNDQLKRADDAARCARKEAEARFNAALSAAQSATQQATPEPDRDGDAFRTAARLGLTLRFYGGCAQSGMPGSPSAYEVVSAGGDPAAAMREAVERASAVIHAGGQAQKLATPEPGLLKTFLAEADRAGITHLPATFGADLAAATPEPEFDDCSSSPTGKHSESWFGNGDCDHCKTGAQNAPMAATPEPLTSFDDPRAQIVYDLLCSDEAPPPEQHWEGWVARRIVDALAATPEPVGESWGWAIEDKHGVAQAIRPARKEFFRCVQSSEPFTAEDVSKMDREWAGLAPHRIVTLYTRPAPGVPDGFALVPVEPTPQMTTLVEHDMWDKPFVNGADVWSAVLAAAQAKGGEHGDSR